MREKWNLFLFQYVGGFGGGGEVNCLDGYLAAGRDDGDQGEKGCRESILHDFGRHCVREKKTPLKLPLRGPYGID